MRILLIEPDEYWEQQYLSHLAEHFEILTARDAQAAAQIFNDSAPQIVVGELLLADGPSYALLENLRRDKNNSALPIVIFSQINTLPDIEAALALGVSGYFVKGRDSLNDVRNLLLTLTEHKR